MRSREVAQSIVALQGHDARDRKYVSDLIRRVSKALRKQKNDGRVKSATDTHGNIVWSRHINLVGATKET